MNTLGNLATIGSMFIPGLQPVAMGLGAVNGLMNGNGAQAAQAAAGQGGLAQTIGNWMNPAQGNLYIPGGQTNTAGWDRTQEQMMRKYRGSF